MDIEFNFDWSNNDLSLNTQFVESTPSIVVDEDGNSYITYVTEHKIPGFTSTDSSLNDIVIAKIDKEGSLLWVKQDLSLNTLMNEISPKIIYNNGSLYLTYVTESDVNYSGPDSSLNDIVLVKMTTGGTIDWVKQDASWNTLSNDVNPALASDENGNVYFAFSGDLSKNIVVVKTDSNGDVLWTKQDPIWNTAGEDNSPSIDVDKLGNIFVSFNTDSNIPGYSLGNGIEIVIFKLDTNGETLWARQDIGINGANNQKSSDINVSIDGNVYLAYSNDSKIYISKINSLGTLVWNYTDAKWNEVNNDNPKIVTDKEGYIYLSHYYNTPTGPTNNITFTKINTNGEFVWSKVSDINVPSISGNLDNTSHSITIDKNGNLYVGIQSSDDIIVAKFRKLPIIIVTETISNKKIIFLLNDIDLSGSLDISAQVLEGDIEENMVGDVVLTYDISLTDLQEIFKFQTDASNIDDLSSVDLKFIQDFSNNTAMLTSIMSSLTVGSTDIPADISMAFEYVQYIALNVFGTRKGVDIFNNEDNLVKNLYDNKYDAFNTFFKNNVMITGYNEKELETSTFKRISHKLFQTIMRQDGLRIDITSGGMSNTNEYQPIPFIVGDTLVMRYIVNDKNIHAEDLTNNYWDARGTKRSYLIKLNVV